MPLQVADTWFEHRKVDDSITVLWEPHVAALGQSNLWHIRGRDRDLLVDSGCGFRSLHDAAHDVFGHDVIAVASHTHFDHCGGHHEFEHRAVHRAEAELMRHPEEWMKLIGDYITWDLLAALPYEGYDIARFRIEPAEPTRILDEGDVIDLGDRQFEVLHLPGHAPGEIGLWEAATGTLFSGDAVYDGEIFDQIPLANIDDYIVTMRRLRELPVTVVHAGHHESFGRQRLVEICDAYLALRAP